MASSTATAVASRPVATPPAPRPVAAPAPAPTPIASHAPAPMAAPAHAPKAAADRYVKVSGLSSSDRGSKKLVFIGLCALIALAAWFVISRLG